MIGGAKRFSRSQPFSKRFSSILTRFSLFRATGNLPKAPHVPSDGVREALGMHLGRPRPWAGLGKGIRLKISCAPHHTPIAELQRFRRCRQTTCIAVRVLTAQPTWSTRTTRRKLFKREQAHGWGQLSAKKSCPVLPRVPDLPKRANYSIII